VVFEDLGLLFFTALILSLLLTPLSVKFAKAIGAVDTPVERSVHTKVMPRMGGLGMAIAIVTSLILFLDLSQSLISFLIGLLIIVATGILDDLFQVSPVKKLLGQILGCVVFILGTGLSIESFGNMLGLGEIHFMSPFSELITLFFMLGVINALNLSDGLDGLAAGLTLFAVTFFSIFALKTNNWLAVSLSASVAGAAFGFLKFNTYPAKLFMGDTGSLTLGFCVSSLVLYLLDSAQEKFQFISLVIVLALPVMDTLYVMTSRILKGKSPVCADKTHLHHRLLALGISHAGVVILFYMFAFMFGLVAIELSSRVAWIQLAYVVTLCASIYLVLYVCESNKSKLNPWFSRLTTSPTQTINKLVGKSLKGLRLVILLGLLLPLFFVQSASIETHNLLLGIFALLVFAYPWREHNQHLNIVYGLFYLTGAAILYVWNISLYEGFPLRWYTFGFVAVLSVWSLLKIRFSGNKEVFLTSGLEMILIFVSWFVPYTLLPVLQVSDTVLIAAKTSCLEAIPLFIAMKIVVSRHPDRNYTMVIGLGVILLFMLAIL